MKKILLTFMGILCALSSVWADTTIYSWSANANSAKNTEETCTGGTAKPGGGEVATSTTLSNGYHVKLDGDASAENTKYVLVKLSTETLKAGDVINVTAYTGSTPSDTKPYGVIIGPRDGVDAVVPARMTTKNAEETISYTVTSTDCLNDNSEFYISRSTGLSVYVGSVSITRPAEKTQWDAPTFSVGAWNSADQAYPVTISAEDGATISYKIGEGEYQTYSAPVNVAANATIYAKAVGGSYAESAVASKTMAAEPTVTSAKFSMTTPSSATSLNEMNVTGGTLTDYNAANRALTVNSNGVNFPGSAAQLLITLNNKIQVGTKVTIEYKNGSSSKTTGLGLFDESLKNAVINYPNNIEIGANASAEYTFVESNTSYIGQNKIIITRNGGSGTLLIPTITIEYLGEEVIPAATYSITYHNNGHGTAPANVESATNLPNPLPTMSETGWNFDGWFTDEALSVAAVAGVALTANADLYAKWTEKGAPTYPLVATWDFTKLTESYDHTTGQMESNGADDNYSATLEIDATNGKLGANGNSAQFNAGTYLKVPVTSTADIVSAKNYNYNQSEDHILINGTPISEAAGYNANADDVNNGYVTVYSDRNNTYIVSVTLTKNDPTVYPVKEGNVYTVAKDSKESLSIALSLVKSGEEIYIPNGTYDFGTEENITISASNVTITGESMGGVIIKNTPAVEGLKKGLFYNKGTNNVFKNLTLQSYAPWGSNGGQSAERAHALWDEGNKTVCENVYLKGRQDTYLSNNKDMTAYFVGGKIEGTTDFICGSGKVFFDGVELYCANSEHKTSGDVIIAPQPLADSKADVTNYGYVFNNCVINGEASQNGTYHLGRGWGQTTGSEVDEWIYAMFANTRMNIAYKTQTAGAMNGSVLTINEQAAAANSIETNKNGVASFVSVVPMDFTDAEGITAYLCTNVTAEAVTLVKAEKVPAGTAFVVVGDKETEYTVPFTAYATTLYNLFKAGAYTVNEGENVYALNTKGQFQKVAAGVTVPAGKAYLKTDVALTKTISIIDEDTTTGINSANSEVVKGVRKAIVDGQLRIVTPNGMFTTTGAQVK